VAASSLRRVEQPGWAANTRPRRWCRFYWLILPAQPSDPRPLSPPLKHFFPPLPFASASFPHRNHGRNKHGRGHTNRVRCSSTAKAIPKDKAIKRFSVRNIVDASALRDIRDASAYDNYNMPKLYIKQYYCIEAAVHQRIVRVRSKEDRKIREPPARTRAPRF